MHCRDGFAQLLRAFGGQQKAQRVFALGLLVERADDVAERSSTLLLAALAPAPVSSEAVSRPLITRVKNADFEEGDELLLLRRSRCVLPGRTSAAMWSTGRCRSRGSAGPEKRQGLRRLRRRLERKHLHVALSYLAGDRCAMQTGLFTICRSTPVSPLELVVFGPLLKVEQIGEELECLLFAQQPEIRSS